LEDFDSDHCAISFALDIKLSTIKDKKIVSRSDVDWVQYGRVLAESDRLQNCFAEMTDSADHVLHEVKCMLKKAARLSNTFGKLGEFEKNKKWWTDDCQDKCDMFRENLKLARLNSDVVGIRNCRREWRQQVKLFKSKHFRSIQRKAFQNLLHEPKAFWTEFQDVKGECAIHDPNAFIEHFTKILNPSTVTVVCSPSCVSNATLDSSIQAAITEAEALNGCITCNEVINCLEKLKNGKSTSDGFWPELLKHARVKEQNSDSYIYLLAPGLCELYNKILRGEIAVPSDWSTSFLCPLHKKGDKLVTANYRGLAIPSCVGKIYAMILNNRLNKYLESNGLRVDCQFGFRKHKGTMHCCYLLQHAIHQVCQSEEYGGMNSKLYVALIDFEKAFDSVAREYIWAKLAQLGIKGDILTSLKALYAKVEFKIKVNGHISKDNILALQGVKQGCPLSPLLFGIFIEQLHLFLQERHPDLGFDLRNKGITDFMFADDVCMLDIRKGGLQNLLHTLLDFSTRFQMKVNVDKSDIIVFRPRKTAPLQYKFMYGNDVMKVKSCVKYLGCMVHCTKGFNTAAQHAAESARRAYFMFSNKLLRNDIYMPDVQIKLFKALILPICLYGAQVWGIQYLALHTDTDIFNNPFQELQFMFLKHIAGVKRSSLRWALLNEFEMPPMQMFIALSCCRWWNSNIQNQNLVTNAFEDELRWMHKGNTECWVFKFLSFLEDLGYFDDKFAVNIDNFTNLYVHIDLIEDLLNARYEEIWSNIHEDPRNCPSEGALLSKYAYWMYPSDGNIRHLNKAIDKDAHQNLLRFRLMSWNLEVYNVNLRSVPRHLRTCRLCHANVEDEFHIIYECPLYNSQRRKHEDLFVFEDIRCFLNNNNQNDLASFLLDVACVRREILATI
jgi:hypothetical protein